MGNQEPLLIEILLSAYLPRKKIEIVLSNVLEGNWLFPMFTEARVSYPIFHTSKTRNPACGYGY